MSKVSGTTCMMENDLTYYIHTAPRTTHFSTIQKQDRPQIYGHKFQRYHRATACCPKRQLVDKKRNISRVWLESQTILFYARHSFSVFCCRLPYYDRWAIKPVARWLAFTEDSRVGELWRGGRRTQGNKGNIFVQWKEWTAEPRSAMFLSSTYW